MKGVVSSSFVNFEMYIALTCGTVMHVLLAVSSVVASHTTLQHPNREADTSAVHRSSLAWHALIYVCECVCVFVCVRARAVLLGVDLWNCCSYQGNGIVPSR